MSGTTSADTPSGDSRDGATASNVERAADYGSLPLSFEANQGQTDPQVQFLTRGAGHSLFLTPSAAVLTMLQRSDANPERSDGVPTRDKPLGTTNTTKQSVVRMTFEGADPHARVVGVDPLPGVVNYFIGDDPSKWRTNVPTYRKVAHENVYPGIDLVYYGNEGQLEYDLIVAPGADPTQIVLAFEGVERVDVDAQGDVVLTALRTTTDAAAESGPSITLRRPVVYQTDEHGQKQLRSGDYVLLASETASQDSASMLVDPKATPPSSLHTTRLAFQIASYDASQPLIIDPVLSWATYLGGSDDDRGGAIAVDVEGNAYVTGEAGSSEFPGTADSSLQSIYGGLGDAFVTKLNRSGTAVVYSTYLGGWASDGGSGIAVDQAGNVYVTGGTTTPGSGFPGTAGSSIQNTNANWADAFVVKLDATGTKILYSTYLGGYFFDVGNAIAVDRAGNAVVTGYTSSSDFIGTAGSLIQSKFGGGDGSDAFVTKLNAAGTAIIYSTYLGGSGSAEERGNGVAVDAAGNAYVTGYVHGPGFPVTAGSLQSKSAGEYDAFVTKVNASGTELLYSTYLGGADSDLGWAIAADETGQAYVTGSTFTSSGFPGVDGSSLQRTNAGGGGDAFVTKLNAAGTAIIYSTYLGGSGSDQGKGIAIDASGNAYVTGSAGRPNTRVGFPGTAVSTIQSAYGGGGSDAFLTKINASGKAIVSSTYLGGDAYEEGTGIAVDQAGNAYVTGNYFPETSEGSGFPGTAHSLIQSTYGGGPVDAFVAKITTTDSFARFRPITNIDLRPVQGKDWFDTFASFTLGAGSNGLAPLKEPVTIEIGTFSTTIPAHAFKLIDGDWVFNGRIDGVKLYARFHQINGKNFEFWTYANCASLIGTNNPVRVGLTIGDDSGSTTVTAKFGSRPS